LIREVGEEEGSNSGGKMTRSENLYTDASHS